MTMTGTMAWFGKEYDAPAWDYMDQVAVPVGQLCSLCGESIAAQDAGIVMPHLWSAEDGAEFEMGAQHVECHLRSMLGSLDHLDGHCSCYTGPNALPRGLTYREEARMVMRRAGPPEVQR